MNYKNVFSKYEKLVKEADFAFQDISRNYKDNIICKVQCSDCCHSVFGLFPIETAYISYNFSKLPRNIRKEILERALEAENKLSALEESMKKEYGKDEQAMLDALSRQRIRCPLLNDENKCSMYEYRPITCRVYGMPTIMGGKMRACWKGNFNKGEHYPSFNLDTMYHELYGLSREMLEERGYIEDDLDEIGGLLLSMPKAVSVSVEELF